MNLHEIMQAAGELSPEEQAKLIAYLQMQASTNSNAVTCESHLAEFERRKASGAYDHVNSLRGVFAHPALNLSFEEIQAITHEASSEWEREWQSNIPTS